MSACMQPGNSLLPEQRVAVPQQDLSPVAGSVPLHGDTQDAATERKDHLTQRGSFGSESSQKPSRRAPEQLLEAHSLQTSSHVQALVRGDTVEARQAAERTVVVPEAVSSEQEALERYRKSCLMFQCQLQTNKKDLEKFISCPDTISTLQNQLQALKHETEALWFDLELQYGHLSQSSLLMTSNDLGDVESDRKQMTAEWRDQQLYLQSRMASLEDTADLLASADEQTDLITQKMREIIRKSVEMSSFSPTDPRLLSDLKEIDVTLQAEVKKMSELISKEQSEATSTVSLCQVLQHSACHLEQLREQLETVQSALQGLDRFLATMREVEAEIPTLQANQDPNKLQNKDWEQRRQSWLQRLQTAAELSDSVDSSLKAAGMTLTMGGAAVTCQDVVRSLSKLVEARKQEHESETNPVGKEQTHEAAQEQQKHPSSGLEEESPLGAKRSTMYGENDMKAQEEGAEQSAQTCGWDVKDQRRRAKTQVTGQKKTLMERRDVLLGALGEIRRAAEHLGLQEPTLPALQHRSRVLTELESRLAGFLAELHLTRDASASSGTLDVSQSGEVENLWEETTRAVSERLEQCCILTELLKKFQSIRGALTGALHRAESAMSQQASYMSKDNLQRTHSRVQGTKAQLNAFVEQIEEVRSVCRQLDTHLRHFPECTTIPFESEADGLMDQWLDISERTDSHHDDLHVALILWDGLLPLGADVESWATNKLAAFAESPTFQTENDIHTLQNELVAQEETIERFHRKATEIQSLLQTTELPLELQMIGTQMKKKVEELKEVVSEAEDVYRQTMAAKGHISMRLETCLAGLQKIQDALLTVSGSDAATVLTKLKEQCFLLQTQDEQAESLLDDLQVLASIASPDILQSLFGEGVWLQEKVRNTHQMFSEVQGHIQDLHRLQRETAQLEQWLQTAEEKSAKQENLQLLQEEALQQRVRTKLIRQLVSSLRTSSLQEATAVEESRQLLERYHGFATIFLCDTSQKKEAEKFQTLCTSTQSCIRDGRQLVNSPLGEHIWMQEQKFHYTEAVVCAGAEGQTRIEELSDAGNSLNQGVCDGDALKQEIQRSTQTTEQQGGELLQAAGPKDRVPAHPEFTTSYQAQRRCSVEELKCQITELPTLFPWPGRAEHRQAYNGTCQLCNGAGSLQLALISPYQQRRELTEEPDATGDKLEDGWSEPKGVCSRLEEGVSNEECFGQLLQDCHHKLTALQERMSACQGQKEASVGLLTDLPAPEVSFSTCQDALQEVTDTEKDLLQLALLKDSPAVSSTAEADACLCQQDSNAQSHKGAVESSVREHPALVRNCQQRLQQVKEASCAQTALKDQPESLRKFCGKRELPDRKTVQAGEATLTELAARVDHLQTSGASSITQETIPAGVTADTIAKGAALTMTNQQAFQGRQVVETFRREGVTGHLASHEETTAVCPSESSFPKDNRGSDNDQTVNKMKIKSTLNTTLQDRQPSSEPGTKTNVAADATKQDQTFTSMDKADFLIMCDAGSNQVQTAQLQSMMAPDQFPLSPKHPSAEPEASNLNNDAQEQEKMCEDISVIPKNVVTIILKMKPQENESVDPGVPRRSQEAELCNADLTEGTIMDFNELKPAVPLSLGKLKSLNLAAQSEKFETATDVEEPECEDTSVQPKKVFTLVLELKPHDAQQGGNVGASASSLIRCSGGAELRDEKVTGKGAGNPEAGELMHSELLNSSTSCHPVSECQASGASAAQTTLPDVKQQEATDFCQREEPTVRSVSCPVEDAVQTGNASTERQILACGSKQKTGRCAQRSGRGLAHEGSGRQGPKQRDHWLLTDESESKFLSLPDMRVSHRLRVVQGSMEPERTTQALPAVPGAAGTTADSPEAYTHASTMQEALSEIQSTVGRSGLINRTPHIDLRWYLQSSDELEIGLLRTGRQVLACRYQPAQLDIKAMAKQLGEAEEVSVRVEEQVVAMKSWTAAGLCDPSVLKRAEEQWSAALLDASATVQVKAAQLEQVTHYHKQMRMTRAFLEVLAAEKEKLSIDALGSSAVQADKLSALMQTMNQKERMMEELLHLSSQLSVHLSDAESAGTLLAWLGDVQEQWRLLEGRIRTALHHASNTASQFLFLMKEAEQLKAKLVALQKSSYQSSESRSDLELVCLTTDLKLYNQIYLQLKSQLDALVHFSLGQKEKDESQHCFQELGSLLNVTKEILGASARSSPSNVNKQLRDLIVWAKQAENHICMGKTLALFPEEARAQIAEMKKFQTDILRRRSTIQGQVEEIKALTLDVKKEEGDQVIKTVEDLYEAIADSLDQVLDTMKNDLQEREKLLSQLAGIDAWLADAHAMRGLCRCGENADIADIQKLNRELQSRKSAIADVQSRLGLVEEMAASCKNLAVGLSPAESRYLVNRLSGLWTELNGLLAHENSASWELEELIHGRTTSEEELCTIQASLQLIACDLKQQTFPLTHETLSTMQCLKHMLIEHQCQAQELQHCQGGRRRSLLHAIGELQDRCRALCVSASEQIKYQHLRRQMEETMDIVTGQIQCIKDDTLSVDERFTRCQTLLVELPMVKTQCQEARDQLEVIAQALQPCELSSERQRLSSAEGALVSWELSVTDDIKSLEAKLLPSLHLSSELPALTKLFQRTRVELEAAKPVSPDPRAIRGAVQRHWVIWRNLESGMRVLEALGQREHVCLKNNKDLYSLRDAAMKECRLQVENLSQAQESLKDYLRAAQGALGFLWDAEATFLSAAGRLVDCAEEQRRTQQALTTLADGFQAHVCRLRQLVPQSPCLSPPHLEQLHVSVLSQLVVRRALLEAQAQLRLESLQRCAGSHQSHRICHKALQQRLIECEARLSECAATHITITSYDEWLAQQQRAVLLMEDLRSLAGEMEDLRAGSPTQGCVSGEEGPLGALWRRWVSARRHVGLLMAHAHRKEEEWKDITASMQQCCSLLASLQAEMLDTSTVGFSPEDPQELLAQAELHHAGLEQAQQALASTEHRLEHALNSSTSQHSQSAGSVGKTLMKLRENIRSLKERNLLVVAAAQTEEEERRRLQEEMGEMEDRVFNVLLSLEACSDPSKRQELETDLCSQKAKLRCITEAVQSRYGVIPADIGRRLQEVQLCQQRAEEKFKVGSGLVQKVAGRVVELVSGLDCVKALLEQRSPTVSEAQNVLKCVWDKLDVWHSRLMLLESEVQDLAEEQPDQALLLMDQLTQPLQLYQRAAQMAEQRTSFLSKIPACLQEFEDVLYSATCWLDEAQSWLNTRCTFTTARSLQNHANSLQLVLDDSNRIRDTLRDFRSVLAEISAVCDISTDQERLEHNEQQVHQMQCSVLEPLEQLLKAAEVVETVEAELKTMEKNIPKIRAILSSMEKSDIALIEHLQNRQVVLANVQSMQRTLKDMERCRGELRLPPEAEENLVVFCRAELLLQQLEELKQVTQQQARLLEIREEEGAQTDADITTVYTKQEALELSVSEGEEDEDDESCHSSSSDTLTCSIPEDPEETSKASEDIGDMNVHSDTEELKGLPPKIPSDMEASAKGAETGVRPVESGFDTNDTGSTNIETGLKSMNSQDEVVAFSLESGRVESLNPAHTPAAKDKFPAAFALEQCETSVSDPPTKFFLATPALESTRLIPTRPITPFAAITSVEFTVGADEELSTAPSNGMERLEASTHSRLAPLGILPGSSVGANSSAEHEVHEELQSWSRLYALISQKLTALKIVQEQHQSLISTKDEGIGELLQEQLVPSGSVSAVLERTRTSIVMLRRTAAATGPSCSGVKETLYDAVQTLLLCLDSLTDFISTPCVAGEDDRRLKLLQQECVLNELVSLWELLVQTESEAQREIEPDEPEALRCLTSLQDCVRTVQLVVASSLGLVDHQSLTEHQGFSSNQLCILEEFDLGKSEIFPSLRNAPSLEQCVLGRHLRDRPGERARLQQASWSLLQGIIHLLDLGEECKTVQMSQVHNLGLHQAILCGHKLLRVLGSQLAFVQHLFQREPEALKCQEDERAQLEVRARALQQWALEQEVAFQTRLQDWTRWEDNCGQLGRVLDELEAFLSNGEPERDDEKCLTQHRLDTCQQTLEQLDEGRAALGLFRDQRRAMQLQTEPASWAGGAVELRWRSVHRRAVQEVQRCKDMQDMWTRFQTDFGSVSEWLLGASKHLKLLSDLANTSDLNQECVRSHLVKLLDFSVEVEAMSLQKASVSREGMKLIHLREVDSPRLRAQLSQLDVSWSRLTSDLSKMQDQLQQLVAGWPPVQLLSDLEDWLKKLETRLNKERETVLKAEDAAHISEVLQHLKELKAGVVRGESLLDFLSQSGPQVLGAEVQTLRAERTAFAETLGALRFRWMDIERDVADQICRVEQMHHTCADGERQLKRLRGLVVQENEQLDKLKQVTSQTQLLKALEEWEPVQGRVQEVAAALQALKTTRVNVDTDEMHPCDAAICIQADCVISACADLRHQMQSLRPGLEQTLRDWTRYDTGLRAVCLHCTRVRCELQHQRAPLLSLQQTQGHMLLLQRLQEKTGSGEELWASVKKSYQGLVQRLHRGTAQALSDHMERERKRWDDVVQEIKEEATQTAETLSLWQEYSRLSENCSLCLQSLWRQWEELSRASCAPEHNTQALLQSVESLQAAAEVLQRSWGDVLAASEPLIGQLEPLASHAIQSETSVVSREVLLLNRTISGKKNSLQENLDEQKLFNTRLEALEKLTQSLSLKMETDSVQVLLELSGLFVSLLDVRDMSGYVTLNNQEVERLQMLSREWIKSMTRTCDMNRALLAENLTSQNLEQKCKNLASIQEKLDQASSASEAQSVSSLPEMLCAQQRLRAEVIAGHQLLQSLLCDAVALMEKETGEKRTELVAQVSSVKRSWCNTVALTDQCTSLVKEQLRLRWTFRCGSKLLRKLLRDVEPLLAPAGPAPCALLQLPEDSQSLREALRLHGTVYTQTMEAGRRLYQTATELESRSQLQSETRAMEEAWESTTSLLESRADQAKSTVQKWSQCQEGIASVVSELDELRSKLKLQTPSEDDAFVQETERILQRLDTGLRDLDIMKTDLSQYVAAGDSALLEQQLEQLHTQWEELCMKVSLRRQEIADRLNAWTIFNGKNKEFCDWLTQMENKVFLSGDLSIGEMVEKLKKDCMEEINLFSENKSHLKQLGEQLLLASDEAKRTQVHGSLQEINQRWHSLFHHIEARVKKLKETLVTVQQLDKNMSNLRLWLSRIEAELSRPITYSVCHHQEIQRRLAEQQMLQKDIEQHTEGVASVLSLCDVLLRDEDVSGGSEVESDSLQETSRSLDQRWRTICALALDRRLRIEETWRLWCKFLEDYSRFEDWLKMAERTAANPNSADVPYAAAKEELKKFEGFQRQVHERLTQLELVNNQYRRLARENRTDGASHLKAMVHEGNRRWDALQRRVAAVLRRLKHFTSQREEFEGTRDSILVWLTELDLQLTNVEHFSESDVHHKMQQLNSFQKEITLNTERIDGLIVFGEGLIQKSSPQDAALIEDELEELHSYCQEVFSRLVRFHQRLSQPPMIREEPVFSLEPSMELLCRPWLGRGQGSLPATPTHLLNSPLERSGRETPLSVDSLALEWDPSGDVGGSSSHEEEEEEQEEGGAYFAAQSVSSRMNIIRDSPRWLSPGATGRVELDSEEGAEAASALTRTPLEHNYLRLMSQCSGSIENIKRVSLILEDEHQPQELGLTGLTATDKQSGVIERWELLQAQPVSEQETRPQQLMSDLTDITLWLENVIPALDCLQRSEPAISIEDMEAKAKELKEMQKMFARYKSVMLSVNLRAQEAAELQDTLGCMNRQWSRACTGLQQWDSSLRTTLMRCQAFHETLHCLLLWLAHAESRRYTVDISDAQTSLSTLQRHHNTLTVLQEELRGRQAQQASLQALWSQLQPKDATEESDEAQEKLHVTGSKLQLLLTEVVQDLGKLRRRLECESVQAQRGSSDSSKEVTPSRSRFPTMRERRPPSPHRSFFSRVLRAAFPLHLLLLLLLLLPCLIPLTDSDPGCTVTNNFARSFYPMLHYTNGPPPT